MIYEVLWEDAAVLRLSDILTRADSSLKQTILATLKLIEWRLATDPLGNSESRAGKRRVLISGRVAVHFQIDFSTDQVFIGNVVVKK